MNFINYKLFQRNPKKTSFHLENKLIPGPCSIFMGPLPLHRFINRYGL